MSRFRENQSSSNVTRSILVPDSFQTSNATQQVAVTIPVPVSKVISVYVNAVATKSDFSAAQRLSMDCAFVRTSAGNVTRATGTDGLGGTLKPALVSLGNFLAVLGLTPDIDMVANTSTQVIEIRVRGQSGITINWHFEIITIENK